MKNEQIHLWFRNKYNEEKKKKQKMSSPSWLKKFSTNFKEENNWKEGFLKIMKDYATLWKA